MSNDMFWEMRQQQKIAGAKIEAQTAQREAEHAKDNVARLETRLERLTVVTQALWQIIQETHQLTEQQLLDRAASLAGNHSQTVNCPQCNRVMNKEHLKCMYCGAQRRPSSLFETL